MCECVCVHLCVCVLGWLLRTVWRMEGDTVCVCMMYLSTTVRTGN